MSLLHIWPVRDEGRPQHPAPSLTTTAAQAQDHAHGAGESPADEPPSAASSPAGAATEASSDEQTSPAGALTWAALVTGVLGLLAGVVALFRTRRTH